MAFLLSPKAVPRYIERYGYAFTWKRLWNAGKVLASMGLSSVTGRPIVWGRPFMMMVEPTNFCNLKCPLCPSGNGEMKRARGHMNLDDFKGLIDEVGEYLVLLMLWNQGEPFINKGFVEMVRYARDRRIPTMTSTNGHYIRNIEQARAIVASGLDEIIVSLDGVDQETYERYRVGGRFDYVVRGARLLAQAKSELGSRTPLVNLQFIVFRHNEGDIAEAERLAGELGAEKFLVKTAQVYSPDEVEEFLPENGDYRRYEDSPSERVARQGSARHGMQGPVVFLDGELERRRGSLLLRQGRRLRHGRQLRSRPAASATSGEGRAYMDFRKKILADRKSVEMCRNCSEGYRGMFSLVKELRG